MEVAVEELVKSKKLLNTTKKPLFADVEELVAANIRLINY